jgi:hypothetical protein
MSRVAVVVALSLFALACGDDASNPDEGNEEELITTVTLTFSPTGGGADVVASFSDPDGDGGEAPTIDSILLAPATNYSLSIQFLNELASPVEDITTEIEAEAEEHQIFITGSAVDGPASDPASPVVTHAYADLESDYGSNAVGDDLPVGLVNDIMATTTGDGELTVTLRHLPEVNGTPVKTSTLASDAAADGIASLPGQSDVNVTFDLSVAAP